MVHHIGDLSYAMGNAPIWDEWFDLIEPVASVVPYMITIGNHEYDHTSGGANGKDPSGVTTDSGYMPDWGNFGDDSHGECGVPVAKRFTMPATPTTRSNPSNGVFWYSFDYASVHTIGLSSEHDMSEGSDQYEWLLEDLSSVNRTITPWVIVELHRPMYDSQTQWGDTAVGVAMRMEVEEPMRDHKVDLVISGHIHSYTRTCDGLYRSQCPSASSPSGYSGPTYVTVGTAGAELFDTAEYPNHWTAKQLPMVYGYGRVTVQNATAMHFEFVQVANDDSAGAVRDDVWIYRDGR